MSADLDLRAVHRTHVPDPEFVASLERQLDAVLAGEETATDPRGTITGLDRPRRRPVVWGLLGAAAAILLVAALAIVKQVRDDSSPAIDTGPTVAVTPPSVPVTPTSTLPVSSTTAVEGAPRVGPVNGWAAFAGMDATGSVPGGRIYLVREGESPRLAFSDATSKRCPALSPDGRRLMFGRVAGSEPSLHDHELVVVTVGDDGSTGPVTTIPVHAAFDGEGSGSHAAPCPLWAPDGRSAAFGGAGAVWIVDTTSGELREVDREPDDVAYGDGLAWRPDSDELAIAGSESESIDVHSVSKGEIRSIATGPIANFAWSPDGATIAFTQPMDDGRTSGIQLVDADGSNIRALTTSTHYADSGLGPVWSPDGDWIAYPRVCGGEDADVTFRSNPPDFDLELGFTRFCTEIALVTAREDDPGVPLGSEVVVQPSTESADGQTRWFPWHVIWAPDGTQLLSPAECDCDDDDPVAVIAIPVDPEQSSTVVAAEIGASAHELTTQQWGPAPVSGAAEGDDLAASAVTDLPMPGTRAEPGGEYGWSGAVGERGWMHNVVLDGADRFRQMQLIFAVRADCFPRPSGTAPEAVIVAGVDGRHLEPYDDAQDFFLNWMSSRPGGGETTAAYALPIADVTLCVYLRWEAATTPDELAATRRIVDSIRGESTGDGTIRINYTLPAGWDTG
jgi:hypothetical protein